MPTLAVIDTTVLQKANAPISTVPRAGRKFQKRLHLLNAINNGAIQVLISKKLLVEYEKQISSPRNEYVRSFFDILTKPDRVRINWATWSGTVRESAQKCRFPKEDRHVLQTAYLGNERTTILTEEARMLNVDECIHRRLRVHIKDPTV